MSDEIEKGLEYFRKVRENLPKMKFIEIKEKLQELFKTQNSEFDTFYEFVDDQMTDNNPVMLKIVDALGKVQQIYQEGGSDQGSRWESVMHFIDQNVYIKVCGYYSSYEGVDFGSDLWDSTVFFEVFPKQKTITIYEP